MSRLKMVEHRRFPAPLLARPTPVAIAALLLLPPLAFGYAGSFTRYVADDFCTATTLADRGMLGAQEYWYQSWNGRFGFVLVIDTLNALGEWTAPLTPATLIVVWVGATWAAVRGWTAASRAWSAALALAVVGGRARLGWRGSAWTAVAAVLLVVGVGCSETSMGLLTATAVCATLALARLYRGGDRHALLTGAAITAVATVMASVVVVVAPGNAVRVGHFLPADAPRTMIQTLWYPLYSAAALMLQAPAYALLAYLVGFFGARASGQRIARRQASGQRRLVMLVGYLAIAAAGLPAFYAAGGIPPDRARIVPACALIAVIATSGYLDGLASGLGVSRPWARWQRPAAVGILTLVLAAGPVLVAFNTLRSTRELDAYAASLQRAADQARAAAHDGQRSAVVERVVEPGMVGLLEVSPNPSTFPNPCVAAFYGLRSITSREPG